MVLFNPFHNQTSLAYENFHPGSGTPFCTVLVAGQLLS